MNFFKGNLFTEYFLTEGIKNSYEWNELEKGDFKSLFKEFENRYLEFASAQNPDETDTEDNLIIPFIEKLGFQYSRQKYTNTKSRQDKPDFILFKDEEDKSEGLKDRDKIWHLGKSILEGKRFKRSLDRRDIHDPFDQSVPSNQILRYLSSVETASNAKILWGILTNGQIWRLYYQKARSRTDDYLAVDLDSIFTNDLFEEERINAFKIFYLFFRKIAFETTDYRQEKTFLEYALEEGKNWEERVSESLKDKVFTEVFPLLAEGFLQDAKRKEEVINEELLSNVYNNTLILLYRLLFVLYAEDRDLLPVRNPKYDDYSLRKLRKEIERRIDDKDIFSKTASIFYGYLKSLFNTINLGDKDLGTPPYNGGLFDPQTHSFLEKYNVADYYIAHAIDYLSRDHSIIPPKRINYRDLTVRQLGSIYEGLLEFKLTIAKEDLAVIKEKGIEKYIAKRELVAQKAVGDKKRGDLYITNDKADRKVTGSYYTPDYIVQYIVENTIGPLVKEKIQNFNSKHRELKSSSKFRGQTAKWKTKELKKFDPAEAILNLKILDPAMGSGHFLVGALDYIADKVLEILDEYSQKAYFGKEVYISSLASRLGDIRKKVQEQAREAGYEIEQEKLEDKHIINRIILKRCVYGVDLNPLAVELAKVSLWLHSFTVGAPLSFLDHHLKCGNSLIGVWDVSDVILPSSPKYQYFLIALNHIVTIQNIYDISLNETQYSAHLHKESEKNLHPFIRKLNVSLAAKHFMEKVSTDAIKVFEGKAFDENYSFPPELEPKYNEAIYIADKKRFFHWRLEFPEVWYEEGREKANGGFDVVIGNPPYVRVDSLPKKEKLFWKNVYTSAIGKYDIYYLFFEKGYHLLSKNGILGLITPNRYCTNTTGQNLRKILRSNNLLITSVSSLPVFEDASVYPVITILQHGALKNKLKFIEAKNIEYLIHPLPSYELEPSHTKALPRYIIPINVDSRCLIITIKILEKGIKACKILNISEALRIPSSLELDSKINEDDFPIIKQYQFSRYTDVSEVTFISRLSLLKVASLNSNRIIKSHEDKIIFAEDALQIESTLDIRKGICQGGVYFATRILREYSLLYLLSIFNSKTLTFVFRNLYSGIHMGGGFLRFRTDYLEQLPIPCISFITPKIERKKLINHANILYQQFLSNNKLNEIITFTIDRLKAEPEQSDVVHDFLAFLAEQMIKYNKQKHDESKGFLNWLEDYLGLKIYEMKNKTKVKTYHNIGWDEFWKILRDNKGKIRFDITRREHVEKIKEEFDTSISKLKPLKNRIELTDKLIDQIVYKLYDLTDEEIKIIEKAD